MLPERILLVDHGPRLVNAWEVRGYNEASGEHRIKSLVCPGLGTGVGGMEPKRCAVQMRMAYKQVFGPAGIRSFKSIHAIHRALRTS